MATVAPTVLMYWSAGRSRSSQRGRCWAGAGSQDIHGAALPAGIAIAALLTLAVREPGGGR